MDSFYQDPQSFGRQQFQWNGPPQAEYVARNDFEAKMIQMLKEIQMGQQLADLQAQMDTLERKQRADYEEQHRNSFENMVYDKLTALQDQLNTMTVNHEEGEKRKTFEEDVNQRLDQIALQVDRADLSICKLVQAELTATEKTIIKQFEQRLKVHEEQSIKRFEEYSVKTAQMLEKLDQEQRKNLHFEFEVMSYQVQRLENRMEREMEQLFHGMYKAQGKFQVDDSDSNGDVIEQQFFMDELPGYIDESIEEEAKNGSLKVRGDPPSQVPFSGEEHEQFLCEYIIASRDDYLSNGAVHEQIMDMEGMREWEYMACAPILERDHFIGAEFPLHQEDASRPPTTVPGFSCEVACTPQVKACFGVLASSASMEKSHEESSWEDNDSSVDNELQKRQRKKQRQSVTQVWIPRGTLEVMKVFNMTEINLGEKSCVPHKAKKRKRRRKASNPQSGIG